MTVEEMHIAVNLGVQKIASFQVDNLLPQEIDHELNASMDRFIKLRYTPLGNKYRRGFEQSQKRIDDLRNLVVDASLPAFFLSDSLGDIPDFGNNYFIERSALPTDYLFLVNVAAQTIHNCGQVIDTNILTESKNFVRVHLSPPITGYVLTDIQINLYQGDPAVSVISNQEGLHIDQLLDSSEYVSGTPTLSIEDQSVFGGTFEETPTTDSNEFYLSFNETFDGTLFVTTIWSDPTGNLPDVPVNLNEPPLTVNYQTRITSASRRSKDVCRYSQHDDLYTLLNDPFNTTKYDDPIYTIQENFVDIHTNDTFVVQRTYVKYIRRPNRINRSTGSGCELPVHTHQEIVDMAIKSILEGISDPRYNTQSQEVAENE